MSNICSSIKLGYIGCRCLPPGVSMVSDMFCNFYLTKNHKNGNNSATTEAQEKIDTDLEFFELYKVGDVHLTYFKNIKILLNKIRGGWKPTNLTSANIRI
jgi:hypothetical protein